MTESCEGRPLPRPHDEVVDQGLGFGLATPHSRRRATTLELTISDLANGGAAFDGVDADTTTETGRRWRTGQLTSRSRPSGRQGG